MASSGELTPEAAEYVPTPGFCVRRFLEVVDLPGGCWCEPCVGEGAIVNAVNEVRDDIVWTANDIRPVTHLDCYDVLWRSDFARFHYANHRWAVGATNPPFSKALGIYRAMLEYCDHVALLVPLAWASGHERLDTIRDAKPDVLVLPDRPWENVREVAWLLTPSQGFGFHVLERTPADERRHDREVANALAYSGPAQLQLTGAV